MKQVEYVIYGIKDTKTEAFYKPIYFEHEVQAKRMFIQAILDEKSVFNQFYNEFELWLVGTFNVETGEHTDDPKLIMSGKEAWDYISSKKA